MGFPLTLEDRPTLSRADMTSTNGAFPKKILYDLRSDHRRWMERVMPRWLTSAEMVMLMAIVSRTLGWNKLIETIPLSVFAEGLRDQASGQLLLDADGVPLFAGTDLQKGTMRKALDGLAEKGLIARFLFADRGRDAFAYMPLSIWSLLALARRCEDQMEGELPFALTSAAVEPLTELEEGFGKYLLRVPVNEMDWHS